MEQGINTKAAEIANESAENATETKRYVIALDQGTTSSRAMLVDRQGHIAGRMQREFPQIYPHPGWVEHDPADILSSQLGVLT